MKQKLLASDVPIRSAVIAWQPTFLPRRNCDAPAGEVDVFKLFDPGERRFAITHGACWCDWGEQSVDELIDTLDWLKQIMFREFGIAPKRIETAFANIPEYRRHRSDRRRGR